MKGCSAELRRDLPQEAIVLSLQEPFGGIVQAGGVAGRDAVPVAQGAEHGAEVLEGRDALAVIVLEQQGHGGAGLDEEDAVGLPEIDREDFGVALEGAARIRSAVQCLCGRFHDFTGGTVRQGHELLHGSAVDERVFGRGADGGGGIGPEEGIGGLEDLVAQEGGVVGMVLEELPDFQHGLGAAVAAEEGAGPVAGEEDVTGALDFLEDVEAGADVADGGGLAQGVVEVA